MGSGHIGRSVKIDQPAEEEAGDGADANYGDDDYGRCPGLVCCQCGHVLVLLCLSRSALARSAGAAAS